MRRSRGWPAAVVLACAAGLAAGTAAAVESDPLPVPSAGSRAAAVRLYNDGVSLLLTREFRQAQQKFEAALALDEQLAVAHNNLAYVLRMQGPQNFEVSLTHYDRAIALDPKLAQAYMYRGVLFTQRGDKARARQDLERLRQLDAKLAADLARVIDGADEGYSRGGIAAQYD